MLNFLTKKTGPDFNRLENNSINMSGIKFHFSVPGNGTNKWGTRKAIPVNINIYDNSIYKDVEFNAKQDLNLNYIRRTWFPITTQIWDYQGYFWQGMAGDFGNLNTNWKLIKPKNYKPGIETIHKLKSFLISYYSELYDGPDGWNTQKKNLHIKTYGNLEDFYISLESVPSDFKTVNINSVEWLTYSKQSDDNNIKEIFYVLPLTEHHYISVNFIFTTTNDINGNIKQAQLKAAEKITSFMKVNFPDT